MKMFLGLIVSLFGAVLFEKTKKSSLCIALLFGLQVERFYLFVLSYKE